MLRIPLLSATAAVVLAASSFLSARQAPAPAAAAPAVAQPAGQRGGGRGGGPVLSPEVAADGRVTFRLRAPGAKEVLVAVAGRRLPLQKDEAGLWSLTTDALAPDIY